MKMPVQGGVRYAAYRSMAVIIRYIKPDRAAASLGVPILPLLFNEALLALGNRVSLHPLPLNTKRDRDASATDGCVPGVYLCSGMYDGMTDSAPRKGKGTANVRELRQGSFPLLGSLAKLVCWLSMCCSVS